MVVLLVLFLSSGFFQVESNQVAFVRRFGELDPTPHAPGPSWAWPVIDQVERVNTRPRRVLVRTFDLAFTRAELLEGKEPTRSGGVDPKRDGVLLTGDANLLHVSLGAQVTPTEPFHRTGAAVLDDGEVTRVLLERATVQAAAGRTVESLLGAGRQDFLHHVERLLDDGLRDANVGLRCDQVDQQRTLSPPPQVSRAFAEVARAEQAVDEMRAKAKAAATTLTSQAAVQAERRRSEARSEAAAVKATAEADAARVAALRGEWRQARRALRERLLATVLVDSVDRLAEVFLVPDGELRVHLERDVSGAAEEVEARFRDDAGAGE
jgi:membrane protease subunit HflK